MSGDLEFGTFLTKQCKKYKKVRRTLPINSPRGFCSLGVSFGGLGELVITGTSVLPAFAFTYFLPSQEEFYCSFTSNTLWKCTLPLLFIQCSVCLLLIYDRTQADVLSVHCCTVSASAEHLRYEM